MLLSMYPTCFTNAVPPFLSLKEHQDTDLFLDIPYITTDLNMAYSSSSSSSSFQELFPSPAFPVLPVDPSLSDLCQEGMELGFEEQQDWVIIYEPVSDFSLPPPSLSYPASSPTSSSSSLFCSSYSTPSAQTSQSCNVHSRHSSTVSEELHLGTVTMKAKEERSRAHEIQDLCGGNSYFLYCRKCAEECGWTDFSQLPPTNELIQELVERSSFPSGKKFRNSSRFCYRCLEKEEPLKKGEKNLYTWCLHCSGSFSYTTFWKKGVKEHHLNGSCMLPPSH